MTDDERFSIAVDGIVGKRLTWDSWPPRPLRRTLWSDGTLFEMVEFIKHNAGPDELTDEELDGWLEGFPVD
jgi:hypothetical protein